MRSIPHIRAAVAAAFLLCFSGGCKVDYPPLTLQELREEARQSPSWRRLAELEELSLDEARKFALENNPDLAAARYAVLAARDRYHQSLGAFAPEVSAGASVGQEISDLDHIRNRLPADLPYSDRFNVTASLRATYLLFDGFCRELEVLARRTDWRIRDADRQNVRRILCRAVAYAYYDVLLASALAEIADSDAAFQRSCLEQADNRYRNGFISESDHLAFRISLNAALARAVDRRCRHEMSRYALAMLMGCPDGKLPEHLKLRHPGINRAEMLLPLDFYIEEALARRPDLRGMKLAIDLAHYRKLQSLGDFAPRISAYAETGFGRMYSRLRGYDFNRSSWNRFFVGYGVEAEWVLFKGFAHYNRYREMQDLCEESRRIFTRQQLKVLNDVENSYLMVKNSAECALLYQESLKWVRTQRRLVEVEYWSGNVTVTRLRGAQNDLVNAEGSMALAVIALLKADAQLVAAISGPADGEVPQSILPEWAEHSLEALGNRLKGVL